MATMHSYGYTLPDISIIIPTLNSARTLNKCLQSIFIQDYPRQSLEIIIIDAGSFDDTLNLAEEFKSKNLIKVTVLNNPLKTGEAGKAVGARHAKGEIIAFVDSDNILPDSDWLTKMAEPFSDLRIAAAEPIRYTYRPSDGFITRYCALLGMNDPICLFLGNYDRQCLLTGRWTEVPIRQIDRGNYLEVTFSGKRLPTIGANGFFIRRQELMKFPFGDYLFDIDVIQPLYINNPGLKIAKVKLGIVHIFSDSIAKYIAKQKRRFRDYAYYSAVGLRRYKWEDNSGVKILKFIVFTILCIPVFLQAAKGYFLKKDFAWFFHPLACCLTLFVYLYLYVQNLLMPLKPQER